MNISKKQKIAAVTGFAVVAIAAGITTLYIQKKNASKAQKNSPQIETITAEPKFESESTNVCDYSMVEAFKKGLVNSVTGYVDKTPYRVDTVKLNFDECSSIRKGYYTQISTEDSVLEKYITINYIDPDTANIPEALKKMLLKFADQTNDSVQQKSVVAHEAFHASHNFSNYNLRAKERADITNLEEIMARFTEFSYLREHYKINGDSTIFKSNFRFYQYALRRGEINPRSTDSTEQRTEQLFVLKKIFEQSNQNYGDIYDDDIVDFLKKSKDYDPKRPNQYQQALSEVFTTIWDGKIVNLDPISSGELEMPMLSENTQTYVDCLSVKEEYRIQADTAKAVSDTANLLMQMQEKGKSK